MKKWILFGGLLLSGCSLDPDSADHYVAEEQLDAVIDVADGQIQVTTSPDADVSLSFWREGEQAETLPVSEEKNGMFTAEKSLVEKGVYFIKADIQTGEQHIMPTKKVWVGIEADTETKEPTPKMKHHH